MTGEITSGLMSQAQFARRRGVSRKAVTGWKKKGFLVLDGAGNVRIDETERNLDNRVASYRGGVTHPPASASPARPARTVQPGNRVEPKHSSTPEEEAADAAERIVKESGAPYSLAEALRIKENYLALLRQLEFDLKSGEVVEIGEVVASVAAEYALVRNRMLSIATRVAPRAAILKSAEQVRDLVAKEVALALAELSMDAGGNAERAEALDAVRKRTTKKS